MGGEAAGQAMHTQGGEGKVEQVWYPVFPPNENSTEVAAWLKNKTGG